ncbi:sigma 54-interacting transcriptional regulator [Enterovibrio nigricans]|uniref:PEP-CTERM-box response regulator transcription factor n=1 Tax=Enterovibrio nigricans DSM 22720 TaxID=1121868 RepID=A0A1T4V820_9GAMM|nr:sigma 54-interacting transcriptional regulator [Enterovibrio nigricans]SKA61089.1 PEP-CTERM-box response regulator transcription factor [Enterovibrio nigricans DSM 22720]
MFETQRSHLSSDHGPLLIIDDDPESQKRLSQALEGEISVVTAQFSNVSEALHQLLTSIVVLGKSDVAAISLLEDLKSIAPRTKVLVIVDANSEGDAMLAMQSGAFDVIHRPYSDEFLRLMVRRAQHVSRLENEVERLKNFERREDSIVGGSAQMVQLMRMVERIASSGVDTLITGESGTGKALLARAIHDRSSRSDGPFITVNCASVPEHKLGAELFGQEVFADNGLRVVRGKIEAANGGTLFLDEIGDMPINLQSNVLKYLRERVVTRLGGSQGIPVDVRVVSASYQDLGHRVGERRFREDLLRQVSDVMITIPPLRERGDDVLLLAKTFLMKFNQTMHRNISGFADDAISALLGHSWPGNVRELQNKIKSALIMADGNKISAADLSLTKDPKKDSGLPLNLRQVREEAERHAVARALARAQGNMSQTATLLGVSRPTLYTLIEKYSLQR